MASVGHLCRCICRNGRMMPPASIQVLSRQYLSSTSPTSDRNQSVPKNVKVTLTQDGSTIVCWHPEPAFPYEHTKPLLRKPEELHEGGSNLKVQYLMEENIKYSPTGPTNFQLEKMFFTNKQAWRSKPRKRYSKETPPKDRHGI